MTDCRVCLKKHGQHYAAVTSKLIQGGAVVGAVAGTLFCIEGMTANDKLFWRNHSLARNLYIAGELTVSGAFLGWGFAEAMGSIYRDADMIYATLSKRKCTCLPAQPS